MLYLRFPYLYCASRPRLKPDSACQGPYIIKPRDAGMFMTVPVMAAAACLICSGHASPVPYCWAAKLLRRRLHLGLYQVVTGF